MHMIVGSKLALQEAPDSLLEAMRKAMSLENPTYWQAVARNPGARNYLSPFVPYFKERNGTFYCGRGVRERVEKWCEKYAEPLEIMERTARPQVKWKSTIALRDYQVGVPEAICEFEQGIIKLPTGFGKTIIGLKVMEMLQTSTLFIVPKKSILGQFVKDIKTYFNVDAGVLGGGEKTIAPVTVATIQTLQRLIPTMSEQEKKDFCTYFGCIIVDECDRTVPEKSRGVIEFFAPRYLYGMTATPRRTDGQGQALEFMFGPVIVSREDKKKAPSVRIVPFRDRIGMGEYHAIIENQINTYARNNLIASIVEKEIAAGRKILVLTKRICHYQTLARDLHQRAPANTDRIIALSSGGAAMVRANELADLRGGRRDFDALLGTFSLLSTGVDIPSLDTLVIAGDLKSDVLTEQSVGRILRLFEGKPDPVVYDIWDEGNYVLKRQGRERQQFYLSHSWPTEIVPSSSYPQASHSNTIDK